MRNAHFALIGSLLCCASLARADEKSTHVAFGWDAGPTYEFFQSLEPISARNPTGLVRDVFLRGRIGGSLFLDGGSLHGFARDGGEFAGELRRARIYTRGEFRYFRTTEYKVEVAYEDKQFFVNDFSLRWRFSRWIDSLEIGYFDPPVSLEALAGSGDRAFMELPPPLSAFAPGYRLGAEVAGTQAWPPLAWALNLSSVGQRPNDAEASSSSALRLTGRLVWQPWTLEGGDSPSVLHVGLSLRYQISGSGSVRFRSRPESFLADYAVDTGDLEGNFGTGGLELAFCRGPLLLQAELLGTQLDAEGFGGVTLYGAYAQASFVLTGEHRSYDRAAAVFRRVEPVHPYLPFRGQWGAVELGARLSWLDLSNGGVLGGRMLSAQLGPSWIWNRHFRVLAGYVFAHVEDRPEQNTSHIVQARLEFSL